MIESKHMYIMFIVAVIVIVIILAIRKKSEGFVDGLSYKVEKEQAASQNAANEGSFYTVPGTFQASLSPRFSNTGYPPLLNYQMPAYEHQASPSDPLFQSRNPYLSENYQPSATPKNLYPVNALSYGESFEDSNNSGDDAVQNNSGDGSVQDGDNTITYDRLIYAIKKNRNLAAGDPIRGDLPIIPDTGSWFRPSVTPHLDLKQGAMTIMGGQGNETAHALSRLVSDSTAGAMQTSAFSGGMASNRLQSSTSNRGHDLQVTAFP